MEILLQVLSLPSFTCKDSIIKRIQNWHSICLNKHLRLRKLPKLISQVFQPLI